MGFASWTNSKENKWTQNCECTKFYHFHSLSFHLFRSLVPPQSPKSVQPFLITKMKNQTRNEDKREVAECAMGTTMYNKIPNIKAVQMTKTIRRRHTCRQLATVNKFAYCVHFDILISFETVTTIILLATSSTEINKFNAKQLIENARVFLWECVQVQHWWPAKTFVTLNDD